MITTGESGDKVTLKTRLSLSKFHSFKANTLEEYQEKIRHMNVVDLCAHAIKYGIRPTTERRRMEKTLIDEFKKARASYLAAHAQANKSKADPAKGQRTLEILQSVR